MNNSTVFKQLRCNGCNSTMTISADKRAIVCPYCGSKELIVEGDQVKSAKIKYDAYRDVELGKQQVELEKKRMENRSDRNVLKGFAIFFLVFFVFIGIMALNEKGFGIGKTPIPFSSRQLSGKQYEVVFKQFHDAGFTNIETLSAKDLVIGLFAKENEVKEVSINGDTEFDEGDYFSPDSQIRISYHSF